MLALAFAAPAARIRGQETPTTPRVDGGALVVRIEDVAGTTVYVNAGTGMGLQPGDTLAVVEPATPDVVSLTVVSALEARSVLRFASRPLPLTRGQLLRLSPLGQAATRLASLWDTEVEPAARSGIGFEIARARLPTPPPRAPPVDVRGRLYMEMTAMRSETSWGGRGIDAGETTRTFATPSMRLAGTVSNLPGGLRIHTRLRTAYRYSEPSLLNTEAIRVYELSAEQTLGPVELRLGRFFHPHESYSGYWDGFLVRFGAQRFGGGASVGFQPDRWNEALSTDTRKVSAFVDYDLAMGNVGWSGDVSVHRTDSDGGLPPHTYVGWSQDARIGRVRISQDLQVDEDPGTRGWVMSRLHLAASLPLTQALYVHGRYSRREPYSIHRPVDVFSTLRSQTGMGVSYAAGWGSVSADVGTGSVEGMEGNRSVAGALFLRSPFGLSTGVGLSASHWRSDENEVASVAPSLTRLFGSVRGRATYRYYTSDGPFSNLTTHSADVVVNLPVRQGWSWSVQVLGRWGDNLTTYRFHTGLSVPFR